MSNIIQYKNQFVNFQTIAPTIYGLEYKEAQVLAILDSSTASELGVDIEREHANIAPYLTDYEYTSPTQYDWVKIKLPLEGVKFLPEPIIKSDTIEVTQISAFKVSVRIESPTDKDNILAILTANGYTDIKIL